MSKHYFLVLIGKCTRAIAFLLVLLLPALGYAQGVIVLPTGHGGVVVGNGHVSDDLEYKALMALYISANGDQWGRSDNWGKGSTADDFAKWYGITVEDGDVIGIELPYDQLKGKLPEELALLSSLRILSVPDNDLAGGLPDFERLPRLTYVDVSSNQFSGNTPGSIAALTDLVYFNVSSNKLTGDILEQLRTCSKIEQIRVANNQFAGTLPEFYQGRWDKLMALDIGQNAFTGTLPVTLANLSQLEEFNASHNQFSGLVPVEFGACPSLIYLAIGDNNLSGALPQQLAAIPNLQLFAAGHNALTTTPDFSPAPSVGNLAVDVSYNAIGFGPLEANAQSANSFRPSYFDYQGQTMPTGEVAETQSIAEPIVITCSMSGAHNTYQWCKKNTSNSWQPISGATSAVFRIGSPTMSDAGRYACQVNNMWVGNLTLWTQTTNLVLTADNTYLPPSQPAANLDRNWTVERTYDGVGNNAANVLSESKQFTDGLGRATQAQARSRANPHVFASQTIYSSGGQPVLQTLAAPIDNQAFAYKEKFAAVTVTGQPVKQYAPINFEGTKASNPDALDTQSPGTLGFYFSTNNTLEPLTPITTNPYSLNEPSEGPLGGSRRVAGPGDAFRMGSGHEGRGWEVPLLKEFDHYLSLRHHFVPGSNNMVSLQRQGTKSVSIDADGRESVAVTNKEGQALVTCLTGPQFPPTQVAGFISTNPTSATDETAPRFLDIHIPAAGEHELRFTLGGQVRVKNINGTGGVRLPTSNMPQDSADVAVNPGNPSPTQSASVFLQPGFYRLISLPSTAANQQTQWFSYDAEYGNFSYTYYDDAGRVVATVAPNGLSGSNVLRNPGFEQDLVQTTPPSAWSFQGTASASYSETGPSTHGGSFYGCQWRPVDASAPSTYSANTTQTVTNLPNGIYTFRAWIKSTGGQNVARMIAENYGSGAAQRWANVNAAGQQDWYDWRLVEVSGIPVTNGQCTIGFYSVSPLGQWLKFDDVVLARLPDTDLPQFVTRNFYDSSNRLLATESTEEGRTEYVYAHDGRIRFSQSALQRPAGRFSYSNYDAVGRVVESGEYTPVGATGPTFQSQLPLSTIYEAEASSDRGGGTQVLTSPTGFHGSGLVGGFNQPGAFLAFNVTAPAAGTYLVRLRYAAGDQAFVNRTLPLYLQNAQTTGAGYLYHVTFPATNSWGRWDTQTVELTLTQGANRILFQQDQSNSGSNREGYVNFDYLEVVREPVPTSTSVLNLLEERTPTNSLVASGCAQRNFVTYDEAATIDGRTQEFTSGAVSKTQNDNVTTWYSYDELGRVIWVVQDIARLGHKALDYKYDFAGNVLEVAYQHGQPDAFHHYYEYDQAQRLYKVYTSTDGTERTLQAKYFYYLHGPLKRVELANRLQGIDYLYTLQGWLKSINHVNQALDPGGDSPAHNNVPKDLFALTLDYFNGDYASSAQAAINPTGLSSTSNPFRYDGSIRAASWRTTASPDRHQMVYQYDTKSQLAQSTYGKLNNSGAYYHFDAAPTKPYAEGGLDYDPNGNIQSLRRTDKLGAVTDNFSYEYTPGTNRLSAVHGGGSPSGTTVLDYDYDVLGQMTREGEGGQNRYLKYDVTGKVTGVYKSTTSQYAIVTFTYDDKGFRSTKVNHDDNGDVTNTTTYVRDIAGNVLAVYESNYGNRYTPTRVEVPLYGSGRVGVLTHLDDGTTTGTDDARYELTDHLGDARVVFHRPTTTTVTRRLELSEPQDNTAFSYEDTYRAYSPAAHSPDYVARLDGRATPAQMTRTLSVTQGDTVTFSAWSLITQGFGTGGTSMPGQNQRVGIKPLLVLGGAASQPAPVLAEGPQPQSGNTALGRLFSRVSVGIGYVLGTPHAAALTQIGDPLPAASAWVRCRLEYEDGTVDQTQELVPLASFWRLTRVGIKARKNGTLTLSVGTVETSGYTHFDDLTVEQTGGMIVQEQHQYAYGSPLVGLNYAVGNKRYRYGYQGQFAEKDGETGFESFELRMYNSRIGRWTSYDPEGQFSSPYVGIGNNPVSSVDPDGGFIPGPNLWSYVKAFVTNSNTLYRGSQIVGFMGNSALSTLGASLGRVAAGATSYVFQAGMGAGMSAMRTHETGSIQGNQRQIPGIPASMQFHFFDKKREGEAYDYMQLSKKQEVFSYLVSDAKDGRQGVLVLPWVQNTINESDPTINYDNNTKTIRDGNGRVFKVLAGVHTHFRTSFPSRDDEDFFKKAKIPGYILLNNMLYMVSPNTPILPQLGKKYPTLFPR